MASGRDRLVIAPSWPARWPDGAEGPHL